MGSGRRDWAIWPFWAGLALCSGCSADALVHGYAGLAVAGGLAAAVVVGSKVWRQPAHCENR